MLEYVILALAVLAGIGLGLVYMVFGLACDSNTNCTGNCNQGRNCDCKDETSGN
jgi:hypothetical protein